MSGCQRWPWPGLGAGLAAFEVLRNGARQPVPRTVDNTSLLYSKSERSVHLIMLFGNVVFLFDTRERQAFGRCPPLFWEEQT